MQQKYAQTCKHNVLILGTFPREAVLEYGRNAHREKCWELKEMHTEKA